MKTKYKYLCILVFAFVFAGIPVLGQEKINQFDENGQRTGIWKKFYNNKNIRYQGQFKAGKEIGTFKYYSALTSVHPTIIKTFSKNSDSAVVSFFNTKGVLESKGFMVGKNRVGLWQFFHEDGKNMLSEENYVNGMKNGVSKTYYKSGKITEILHFKDNKLHGNVKRYGSNGVLLDDLTYENGILNGPAKYYNIKGELIYYGNYLNDEKTGKWEYFENGKPIKADKQIQQRH